MPGSVVQAKTAVANTATTPASITLNSAATAGNILVVIYGGDDYVSAGNKPSGFTEPTGARQEGFLGHYVWYKVAVGGETTFSCTPGSAVTWCMIALEVSGLGSLDTSNGTILTSSGATMATPTVTPAAGARFAVASIGGATAVEVFNTGMGSWTNSYAEQADIANTLASGTRDNIGAATLSFTATGSSTTDTTATWDGAVTPQHRTGIILVFQESGAATGPDPVWAPHLLVPPGRISPAGRWTAWSGDPSTNVAPSVVDANAAEAVATGTADNATASVAPNATEALATGTALDALAAAAANTAEATATGTALTAATAVTVNAAEATAVGTAEWDAGSSISLDLVADNAIDAVGTAYDATVSTAGAGTASPTEAAATGTASDAAASIAANTTEAVATGTAFPVAVAEGVNTTEATATGTADNPAGAVAVNAGNAPATGTANDATVSTASQTNAPATEAVAAGAAQDPSTAITFTAGTATASGTAELPSPGPGPAPAEATATASAFDTSITLTTFAGVATSTAAANDATGLVGQPGAAHADVAVATGAAFDARPRKLIPRPFGGVTVRPDSGRTSRLYSGVTPRP